MKMQAQLLKVNYRPVSHFVPFYHSPGHSWHIALSPRRPRCCRPGTSEAGPLAEGRYSLSVRMCNCGKDRHSGCLSDIVTFIPNLHSMSVLFSKLGYTWMFDFHHAECLVLAGGLTHVGLCLCMCVCMCVCGITTMEANHGSFGNFWNRSVKSKLQ